jgi:hypothetical protein
VSQARLARLGRGLAPEELADLLMPRFSEVRILGVRGNARVRAYREQRRQGLRSLPSFQRFRLGLLPGRLREPFESAADARVRREALGSGAPSPLAIEPGDFTVGEEDVGAAERLLAICTL